MVWKACERLNIRPPGVKPYWSSMDAETQAMIIAYTTVRDFEDAEFQAALAGAKSV